MSYDVTVIQRKTSVFRNMDTRTSEEAEAIAELLITEDGEEGQLLEREIESIEALPSEEF